MALQKPYPRCRPYMGLAFLALGLKEVVQSCTALT